ncbi:probable inactive leucine-rich repeat receptor-like protein kinase At3g03770 [Nicotiana sylvestris]|uniref:Probable inactive leucine-rich repeat receptor-like protein kinase At3g03770 n=2 Tax=Nicotiana TaxID=4085 RepID=A0A1S3XIH9_TOBAC|nr:PREDICTED: probable inactive leucine-rich repeat receptor-like protein kinase At3g03770 [Nicotiana sylvestris]XP_009797738.1 PREDICTED: probable inactive leucine-rich repeat receptor-like protein kinase At3g03770 [Nicotiana sylvestris]XP_009797739.1 PREDICTED: probable inactive leucine-rich repeat receptor-like protein kinase At3g03770 [Nicotiana sylvestris]XP_009797740.1 PREDICTED: probable inactive leucine-rich repeat receptor-like protein kinase At3g03770 [Nicotiana sylvestris]XP_00979774
MEKHLGLQNLLVLAFILLSVSFSEQLQSSQVETLLRIQNLLNYPPALSSWNNDTHFCKTEPSSTVTVICYEESITQLHIIGVKGASAFPKYFSIDSFVTTLVKLPSLKVLRLVSLGLWGPLPSKLSRLSLLEILDLSSNYFQGDILREISSLTSLQTLVLDGNKFTGKLPNGIGSLMVLAVLSVKNNSLDGHLPDTLQDLHNLRLLALSRNNFTGDVPDLSSLENLQVLDLADNSFGPKFPRVSSKIQSIVLRNNKFTAGIPEKVQSYNHLEHMDISLNRFMGPFPPSLLSLPSITYLDVAGNKFTGMVFEDNQCNAGLDFVDLSTNLLSGRLPSCLVTGSKHRIVHFSNNCLATGDSSQHPFSFCRNEALAVGILPHHHKQKPSSKVVLALIICGSITGVVLVCATILIVRNFLAKEAARKTPTRLIVENASSAYTLKLFTDARYVTQAMKLGSLSLPSYRTFSLEELKVATNNFDAATFIGNNSDGQTYRGQLKDGSHIAIRRLKMKQGNSSQNVMHHIELMSKLRHHLVSTLGHCFECYLDDSSVSRIFLVFEYVPNGNLRSWISDRHAKRRLTWTQRIATAIGVARGIQFLHTRIVPGIFSNNLKITDIVLDQNLVAKTCSYNLPILSENVKENFQNLSSGSKELKSVRANYEDKSDVFDFGVILLEIISGRQINTKNEARFIQNQLQESIMANEVERKNVVDPAIRNYCLDESLKTMIEICSRCLLQDAEDRPSVEDAIWNLQFAAQVQDALKRDSSSSDASPISDLYNLQTNLSCKSKSSRI